MSKRAKIIILVTAVVCGVCILACAVALFTVFRYQPAVTAAPGREMRWPTRPNLVDSVPKRVRAFLELGTGGPYTVLGWSPEGILFYEQARRGNLPQVWAYDPDGAGRPRRTEAAPPDLLQEMVPRTSILEWVRSPLVRPADAEPMVRNVKVRVDGMASPDRRWVAVVVRHIYGPEDVLVVGRAMGDVPSDELVFTVPVGPEGVQYGPNNTGPAALAVAPDGAFWIADTQGNRLLRYDRRGVLLNRIDLNGYGAGPIDVEPTGSDILVLVCSANVLRFSTEGNLLATYEMPQDLGPEDGLTGLAVGDQGEVLLEFEMGAEVAQLVNAQGAPEPVPMPGYTHEGSLYKAQLAGWQSKRGTITAGSTRIDVSVPNILAGLWILAFAPSGGLYVVVEEMERAPTVLVDQTVRLYGRAGELRGSAAVPVDEQYTHVQHGLAVGPDGAVYALVTRPDQVEVLRLDFCAEPVPVPSIETATFPPTPSASVTATPTPVLSTSSALANAEGLIAFIETRLRPGLDVGFAYDYYFGGKTHAETEPLVAGGRSADYSEGRGAMPTDFGGYAHAGWQRTGACASAAGDVFRNSFPVCREASDDVAWMIRVPNASILCEDVLGNWQTTPAFRIEVSLPDNPTINGFAFEAPFFSEQFANRVENDLYPLLGARLNWRASKCDEAGRQAFDVQLMTLIESITNGTADAETLDRVEELVHLAESIVVLEGDDEK